MRGQGPYSRILWESYLCQEAFLLTSIGWGNVAVLLVLTALLPIIQKHFLHKQKCFFDDVINGFILVKLSISYSRIFALKHLSCRNNMDIQETVKVQSLLYKGHPCYRMLGKGKNTPWGSNKTAYERHLHFSV